MTRNSKDLCSGDGPKQWPKEVAVQPRLRLRCSQDFSQAWRFPRGDGLTPPPPYSTIWSMPRVTCQRNGGIQASQPNSQASRRMRSTFRS